MNKHTLCVLASLLPLALCANEASDNSSSIVAKNVIQKNNHKTPCNCIPQLSCGCNEQYKLDINQPDDFFATASFIYWQAIQEGLETCTATTLTLNSLVPGSGIYSENIRMKTGQIDFDYEPGFKVGLGGNLPYDNWELYSEYTWYQHQFSGDFDFEGPNTQILPGNNTIIQNYLQSHFILINDDNGSLLTGSSINTKFDLKLNFLVLELARRYYVGRDLTFRTHFGVQADLNKETLSQNFNLAQTFSPGTAFSTSVNTDPVNGIVRHSAKSWALGPRVGVGSDYLLAHEFRIFGKAATSLLFTRYILKSHQTGVSGVGGVEYVDSRIDTTTYDAVRPNLELGLGIAWGTYFNCKSWYLDLALSYDFMVMWDQNMFRAVNYAPSNFEQGGNNYSAFSGLDYANLYLHGLTFKVGLEF